MNFLNIFFLVYLPLPVPSPISIRYDSYFVSSRLITPPDVKRTLRFETRLQPVHGVSVLVPQYLVVTDQTSLLLFDLLSPMDVVSPLDKITGRPFDVTKVGKNKVAVTYPDDQKVKFFSIIDSKLVESKNEGFKVNGLCWGLDRYEDSLFVVTHNPEAVLQVDMKGVVQRELQIPKDVISKHVLYHAESNTFYFTSTSRRHLCAVQPEEKVTTIIEKIPGVEDVAVTTKGEIYVTSRKGCIYQLNISSGEAAKVAEHGGYRACITYAKESKCMYVVNNDKTIVFDVKDRNL